MEIRRFLPQSTDGSGAEIRATQAKDGTRKLSGFAIRWNVLSVPLQARSGSFREKIARGSITNLRDDILMLYDHEVGNLLGRTSSGTLGLVDAPEGLSFSVELPPTQLGNDVYQLVKRRDLKGMSFAFTVLDGGQTWDTDGYGNDIRTITKMRMSEISVVASPAYPATDVQPRSLDYGPDSPVYDQAQIYNLWIKDIRQAEVEMELLKDLKKMRRQ